MKKFNNRASRILKRESFGLKSDGAVSALSQMRLQEDRNRIKSSM